MNTSAANPLRYLDPEVLQTISSLSLVVRRVVQGLRVGAHASTLRGISTDFVHHRPYAAGDAIRHIDWRVYGRTERYHTKLYQAETNFDAYLLLDASSSMRYASGVLSKLEYAKYMAASLAWLLVQQRDSVGLAVFDSVLRSFVPPGSTSSVVGVIDHHLQQAKPEPRTDIGALLHEMALRLRRRSVILLFSDLLDETGNLAGGLDHLRFDRHLVTVFHTLDRAELEMPLDGTVRFVGLEGEAPIITQPRRIREAYLQEVEAFTAQIRAACNRCGAEYVLVNTSRPLDVVLSEYLACS